MMTWDFLPLWLRDMQVGWRRTLGWRHRTPCPALVHFLVQLEMLAWSAQRAPVLTAQLAA